MGKTNKTNNIDSFSISRVKQLETLYDGEIAWGNRASRTSNIRRTREVSSVEQLKKILASEEIDKIRRLSNSLYRTDPIYSKLINYLSTIFLCKTIVTPHRLKKRDRSENKEKSYTEAYSRMLEITEGLNLQTQIPSLLREVFKNGIVFFTTYVDQESETINTIVIPDSYCKHIGQTNFGTNVIQMNMRYFDSLGVDEEELQETLESFPAEIQDFYDDYVNNNRVNNWYTLDPRFSSCLMMNDKGIPNLIASYEGLLNFDQYTQNELDANTSKLERIVWHKMPIYEDQLVFTVEETKAIHKSMSKIINASNKTRLITTYGDLHVENMTDDSSSSENNVLSRSFKSIFNKAGFNDAIFTGESVTSLKYSLIMDKSFVWNFIEQLEVFYNLVINNYFQFGAYEANISILQISPYSYNEDIERYRDNATLGIGKLDFIVASGIKQKNIQDRLELEDKLNLDSIKPLKTSYTQSGNSDDTVESIKKTPVEEEDNNPETKKEVETDGEKEN